MANSDETGRVLRAYAKAWLASDLEKVLASYHDDIELHYMGESPIAGTHRGRDAAFAVLAQASTRTARTLIDVEDVLVGESLGAVIAVEDACNDGASDEPSTCICCKGSGERRDDYLKASSPMVEEHDGHS